MVWAIFGINHPRDFWKFWNWPCFTQASSEFASSHMWLLVLIDLANKLDHIEKLVIKNCLVLLRKFAYKPVQ